MKEDGPPEHVKKYKKLSEKAEQMHDTTAHEHRKAYLTAQDKHLRNKEGLIDYKLLDKKDIQREFVKTMKDHYVSAAKKALSVGKEELDESEEALLMNAYMGVTEQELKQYVGMGGKDFTFKEYEQQHPKFMKRINEVLQGAAGKHLDKEHKSDLVKAVKADEYIDSDYINLDQAKYVYKIIDKQGGAISESMIEKIAKDIGIPEAALKKKKKEEEEEELAPAA